MKKTNRLILSLSSIVLTSFLTQQIVLADDLNGEIETITSIEDYKLKEEENKRNEKLEDTEVTNKNITTLTDNDAESIKKVNQQNSDSDTGKYESKDNITEFKSSDLKIADDQDSSIRTISESYEAVIIFGQYSIDTKPWGEEGYKNIGTTDTYVNKNVSIIDESSEGHYKLAEFDGKKLGWIDHRAFGRIDATTVARIGKGSYSVDTQPWGMEGYKKINETDRLLGKEVKVVSQKQNKEYSYVLVDDKPYGWVDNRALISKEEPYDSWIINPNFSIDNAPWGERNFKKRDTSNRYVNERIKVLGVNQTKTYYLIADQQGKTLGWIDHRALSNANYTAQIIRGDNFSIDTRPWGTPGYKRIGLTGNYLYSTVQVIGVTNDKSYMLVLKDNKVLGWIDNRALSSRKGIKTSVYKTGFSVDTKPWGITGSKKITTSNHIINQQVEIIGKNDNGLYLLIRYGNGKLGWIDNRAIKNPNIINVGNWRLEEGNLQARGKNYYVGNTFIVVDIQNQRMWGVKNNKIIVDTPVITGKPGSDTPRGHYKIQPLKQSPSVLIGPGYASPVQYWMPFIGNTWGIHDSNWQHNGYGGQLYRNGYGSHGCINTPLGAVRTLYNNFSIGSNVVVF